MKIEIEQMPNWIKREILKDKPSYILYFDKMQMIDYLSDEDLGRLMRAVNTAQYNYCKGLSDSYPTPDFSDNMLLKLIYEQISNTWESDNNKWVGNHKGLKQYSSLWMENDIPEKKEDSTELTEESFSTENTESELPFGPPDIMDYLPAPPQDEDDLVPFPDMDE